MLYVFFNINECYSNFYASDLFFLLRIRHDLMKSKNSKENLSGLESMVFGFYLILFIAEIESSSE